MYASASAHTRAPAIVTSAPPPSVMPKGAVTTGRRSGEQRTTPLIHRTDGDRWVVVASKGGAPQHPSWFENLSANPEATIQVRGEVVPVRATTAEGDERDRLWSLMTEAWPAYDEYQARTQREIPVVVLSRR